MDLEDSPEGDAQEKPWGRQEGECMRQGWLGSSSGWAARTRAAGRRRELASRDGGRRDASPATECSVRSNFSSHVERPRIRTSLGRHLGAGANSRGSFASSLHSGDVHFHPLFRGARSVQEGVSSPRGQLPCAHMPGIVVGRRTWRHALLRCPAQALAELTTRMSGQRASSTSGRE